MADEVRTSARRNPDDPAERILIVPPIARCRPAVAKGRLRWGVHQIVDLQFKANACAVCRTGGLRRDQIAELDVHRGERVQDHVIEPVPSRVALDARSDEGAPLKRVNAVFDAFLTGGAGRLAAWIALSGDLLHLEPVRAAVLDLVEAIRDKMGDADGLARERIASAVLFIALGAFGEALIGPVLREILDQSEDQSRKVVAGLLPHFVVNAPKPV